MKSLEKLSTVERGRLLHQLFPEEIPALLQFVQGVCETIREHEQQQRKEWKNGIYSFDFWLSLVKDTEAKITQYNKRLHSNSRLFADQLFDGYIAMYMMHCLTLYTQTRKHANRKFTLAFDLLFID